MKATTTARALHQDITYEKIEAVMYDGNTGFCVACGAEANNVEPDAAEYACEQCGELTVYGTEEVVLRYAFDK